MKSYDFLKNEKYYIGEVEGIYYKEYVFATYEGRMKCQGSIIIPKEKDEEITWGFSESTSGKKTEYKDIISTPIWFENLYKKAKRKEHETTRLKGLFGEEEDQEAELLEGIGIPDFLKNI